MLKPKTIAHSGGKGLNLDHSRSSRADIPSPEETPRNTEPTVSISAPEVEGNGILGDDEEAQSSFKASAQSSMKGTYDLRETDVSACTAQLN